MTKSLPVRLLNVAVEFTNWNPVTDKIRTFVDSQRSNLIESPEDASIKTLLIQSNQCRLRVRFKSLNSRQGRNHARRATHLVG